MYQMGIDISQQQSKYIHVVLNQSFDYVVTVCDQVYEVCPEYSGNPVRIHCSLPDPSDVHISDDARQRAFQRVAYLLVDHVRVLYVLIQQHQSSDVTDGRTTKELQ